MKKSSMFNFIANRYQKVFESEENLATINQEMREHITQGQNLSKHKLNRLRQTAQNVSVFHSEAMVNNSDLNYTSNINTVIREQRFRDFFNLSNGTPYIIGNDPNNFANKINKRIVYNGLPNNEKNQYNKDSDELLLQMSTEEIKSKGAYLNRVDEKTVFFDHSKILPNDHFKTLLLFPNNNVKNNPNGIASKDIHVFSDASLFIPKTPYGSNTPKTGIGYLIQNGDQITYGKGNIASLQLDPENTDLKMLRKETSNTLELQAIYNVLKELINHTEIKEDQNIFLHSDSLSILNYISNMVENDENKTKRLKRDLNEREFTLLNDVANIIKEHQINIVWVRGHNQTKQNEIADILAKDGANLYYSRDKRYNQNSIYSFNTSKTLKLDTIEKDSKEDTVEISLENIRNRKFSDNESRCSATLKITKGSQVYINKISMFYPNNLANNEIQKIILNGVKELYDRSINAFFIEASNANVKNIKYTLGENITFGKNSMKGKVAYKFFAAEDGSNFKNTMKGLSRNFNAVNTEFNVYNNQNEVIISNDGNKYETHLERMKNKATQKTEPQIEPTFSMRP